MVKIKKVPETTCWLYCQPDDKKVPTLVGEIATSLELSDVRCQIKRECNGDYFIEWKNPKSLEIDTIMIDNCGKCSDWPEGFYDEADKFLDELIDM